MEIGQAYPGEFLAPQEGPSFIFTHDRCHLVLQLNGLTDAEIRTFQTSEEIQLALYSAEGIAFLLLQIPQLLEWSDAPYSVSTFSRDLWPVVTAGRPAPRLDLEIVLIDGSRRRILGIRRIRIGESLSQALLTQIDRQKAASDTPAECLKKIASIQKKTTPEQMVAKAAAMHPAPA